MLEEVERGVRALFARKRWVPLEKLRVLDVGCGEGYWLRLLAKWGASPENLAGIDLLPERVEAARALCPQLVTLTAGDASSLEFGDATFDVLLSFTVFSSILDPALKTALAREMLRVLRPDGFVSWYDFHANNPRNKDVRGIRKREIERLFSGCRIDLERITLAPPLGRLVANRPRLYTFLSNSRALCTHYLGRIEKR